jgi:hypothetical protein
MAKHHAQLLLHLRIGGCSTFSLQDLTNNKAPSGLQVQDKFSAVHDLLHASASVSCLVAQSHAAATFTHVYSSSKL